MGSRVWNGGIFPKMKLQMQENSTTTHTEEDGAYAYNEGGTENIHNFKEHDHKHKHKHKNNKSNTFNSDAVKEKHHHHHKHKKEDSSIKMSREEVPPMSGIDEIHVEIVPTAEEITKGTLASWKVKLFF